MTCWTSSSISVALVLAACAGARPAPAPRAGPLATIAVLPIVNMSGTSVPLREMQAAIELELSARQIAAVPDARVDEFLARHRLRWTGGLDADSARAAQSEIGTAGVLVTVVDLYEDSTNPRLGVTMRLIDGSGGIRWFDGVAMAGDESPGAFELGIIHEFPLLRLRVLDRLANSLSLSLQGRAPVARSCDLLRRDAPKESFRSPDLDARQTWTVAVLPFVNQTERRFAGDLVALQFARQLEASGRFRVVEPGIVREDLLRFRIVMEGGISLDIARVVLELVHADFVVAGYVHDYEETRGSPAAQFTTLMLDQRNSEVVWEGSSWSRGDDGVFFFDVGAIATAPELVCRMARASVADALAPRPHAKVAVLPGKAKR